MQDNYVNLALKEFIIKMKFIDYLVALGLFLFAMLLASCSRERQEITCREIYQPVCYKGKLYVNECYAMKEGIDNADLTSANCILNLAGCECN